MSASPAPRRPLSIIREFLDSSAASGIVLMAAAALALLVANLPVSGLYFDALHIKLGGLSIQHWINDGLMAGFFLLVALEIKREIIDGELSSWPRRMLPGLAALGGMLVPALVYLAFNLGEAGYPRGWAIPSATDIAFALGVLSLLGPRVPLSLRVFLAALAIIDDLGAVVIITIFYTSELNGLFLACAVGVLAVMLVLNRLKVLQIWPYLGLAVALWFFILQSGVHATLAGVALAICIPLRTGANSIDPARSPLLRLEHAIAPWVTFLIVPLFGFANAGVSFAGVTMAALLEPVPLGVALGLLVGKQVGVFGASALVIRLGWAELPKQGTWMQLYAVALICGIGFTMSLFIGLLAFPDAPLQQDAVKLGVFIGSGLSAIVGALLLRAATAPRLQQTVI